MKILILSWRGLGHPNSGGAEIVTHQYAKSWVKKGHSVIIFTASFLGSKEEENIDGVKYLRNGDQLFLKVQLAAFWWYLILNKDKFDLVIDQFHGLPFFTPLYVRVKKLAFIHEVTKEVWFLNQLPGLLGIIIARLGYLLEPWIFKLLYLNLPFLTVSNSTKKDLVNWGVPRSQITIIPNGIILPRRNYNSGKVKKIISFLGSVSKDKGIETAIDALAEMNKDSNEWVLWIIGKGEEDYLRHLKKKITKLKLNKCIKFWGFVTDRQKYNLLSKSFILINPSIREGWGLVVIEAASVGTPTVGSDVPGLRDSITKDTGILVNNNQQFAQQILSLYEDPKRYQVLKKNCINLAKSLDWSISVDKSMRLINKIVKD